MNKHTSPLILIVDDEMRMRRVIADYLRSRKEDIPPVLRPYLPADFKISSIKRGGDSGHIRQQKHLALKESE